MKEIMTIALPKGKLLPRSLELLQGFGVPCADVARESRRLTFDFPAQRTRLIICRPTDIPTYVEYGAADAGFVGKDTIVEQNRDVAELLDLKFGACRFMVAVPEESAPPRRADGTYDLKGFNRMRVATKFPRVARLFFNEQGMQVTTIKLHGNIELAPKVGLAEMIVDIVSSGATLRENKLVEIAPIFEATTRLIANRVTYRMRFDDIRRLTDSLREQVNGEKVG
ncbi:MAG: ATP phosphoribosyltransferase [Gracilibacteraceae bacterium]|jgi:ATP phosphoribosyltransferase|nr:ATP phosphoribosyltransferase [Gracilibacteraceae bacterium]